MLSPLFVSIDVCMLLSHLVIQEGSTKQVSMDIVLLVSISCGGFIHIKLGWDIC